MTPFLFFHDAAFSLQKLLREVGAEALHAGVGGLHLVHRGGNVGGGSALGEEAEGKKGTEEDSQQSAHDFFLIPPDARRRAAQRAAGEVEKGPEARAGNQCAGRKTSPRNAYSASSSDWVSP